MSGYYPMNAYTNNTFEGHWPVGTAAVVIAESQENAARMLNEELVKIGLQGNVKPEDMNKVDVFTTSVNILNSGEY